MAAHILDEASSRDALLRYPDEALTWCAKRVANEWAFLDVAHAVTHLRDSAGIEACGDCLRAVRAVIDAQLGDG